MKWVGCFLMAACLSAAPQAVVFDYGGVLTGEPDRASIVEFLCDSFQLTDEEFETVNQRKREAIKAGKSDAEFWIQYGKDEGIALSPDWADRFHSVMKKAMGVNPKMYALVDQLKEREITVGLLSNIDERIGKLLRGYGYYEPFDPCLLSHEIGADKPNAEAYRILIERLDCQADEIVFIDDKRENVEAAQKEGIDAILFESHDQIVSELQKRGAL
jgi:putative hydrolase of the HAD superfamily